MNKRKNKRYQRELRKHRKALLYYKKYRERKRQIRLKIRPFYLESSIREEQKAIDDAIRPPKDFRYIENFKDCNIFFHRLNHAKPSRIFGPNSKYIYIDCTRVEKIDFMSICIFGAICEELKEEQSGYSIYGKLPLNKECKTFILESGFLDGKVNEHGRPYPIAEGTNKMTIQKGETKFKDEHIQFFVNQVSTVYEKLGLKIRPTYMITVIKEICGNSVEWSKATRDRWTLAIHEGNDSFEFVAIDLGRGILKSLHMGYQDIINVLGLRTEKDILKRAYEKKYSSESQEKNRHKGLPFIRRAFYDEKLKDLYVATNSVLLDFTNDDNSQVLDRKNKYACPGTVYRWIINKKCK